MIAVLLEQDITAGEDSKKVMKNQEMKMKIQQELQIVKNKPKKQQSLQIEFITMIYHIIEFKMSHTDWLKKKYADSTAQLHAVQAADCCVILVARNKVKETVEWQKTNKEKQEAILNCIKTSVMQEREHQELSDK